MTTPTLQLEKTHKNGVPAIRLIVRNATAELRQLCDSLSIKPDCSIANCRTIICLNPGELGAARKPLAGLFGHKGEWLGKAVV